MTPETLCGLLAEPDRLATFAAVVLGCATASEVANRTGLGGREVAAALGRLEKGGLVATSQGRLVAQVTAFKDVVRERAPQPADGGEEAEPEANRAAALRAFVRAGRIIQMPAARAKRRVLLEHVAAVFEPGVRYREREVDASLRAWYDDHAALRRYLVDEGLMSREHGVYWRTGGHVEVGG